MICLNCNTQNEEGKEFCVNCGNYIGGNTQPTNGINSNMNQMGQMQSPPVMQTEVMQNQNNVNNGTSVAISTYFSLMIGVVLKPFTTFKEEINKFTNIKDSALLSLVIAIIATIVNLIGVMINTVCVKSWSLSGNSSKIVLENLKDIHYIEVIGKSFLIYFGIMIGIACIYYLGSLIIKKETNFSKLLGIAALSTVPYFIASLILAPLLSLIYTPLSMIITIVGGVYTILLVYEMMNQEIKLEGNVKYYFNLVCLSIILSIVYFVCFQTMTGEIEDLFDLLDY